MVFMAFGYPKFFTPNDDGYNDTWNVYGIDSTNPSSLYIFDRYGKFLASIDPTDSTKGWDGFSRGVQMPPNDYWFVLEFTNASGETETFRAHFSLVQ